MKTMNKGNILALLLAMLLFPLGVSAQKVKASFGVTGGVAGTMMHTEPAPAGSMSIGKYGGAFTTVTYGNSLALRTGVNYITQGIEYELKKVPIHTSQTYLNVPVAFMYKLKSFVAIEAGFYQNILKASSLEEDGDDKVLVTPDEGALAYNFGFLAGVSFNLGRFAFVDLRYNHGLSDSYVIYGVGYPSSSITVGLGVNLISTRKRAFKYVKR